MARFDEAVKLFGQDASAKLKGPGQREALIRTPVDNFIRQCGDVLGLTVQPHDEVSEDGGAVRPDYAVDVNGAITGHIELKAPGVSLDPSSYGKTTHNARQWQRLRELPNLLHTNGIEWRLWRNGEMVGDPVHMAGAASLETAGSKLRTPVGFDALMTNFIEWKPVDITTVQRLVEAVAPLTRLLKEQVVSELQAERKRKKAGVDDQDLVFLGLRSDWRELLFPLATDEEFADGYAQTITFALLLAQAEGIDLASESLHTIGKDLHDTHSLMGKTLQLLTDQLDARFLTGIELLVRVISAVDWDTIQRGKQDVYLHLYEHFLQVYDYDARKKTGSYYTPVEVVDSMVRLTEDVLEQVLNRPQKFRDPHVDIIDPAMGTGTYPLSIMRRVAQQAAGDFGPGAAPEALTSLMSRLYGFELQSGPYSVAELRVAGMLKESGAQLPKAGLQLFVTNTLANPEAKQANLGSALQLIAQQSQRANQIKRETNIQVVIGNPPYKDDAGGMGEWVENGDGSPAGRTLMEDFKEPGNGIYERKAKNLYAYFWRWAMWKVFESTNDPLEPSGDSGVITFITAQGYQTGPGFAGMRRYIREHCSRGWIIDLTPEGKRPPQKNAIFSIETPVGIGIFVREPGTVSSEPADIKHIALHGTREEKYLDLEDLTFEDPRWREARKGWTAPFTAASDGDWDRYPAMHDLFPWWQQGMTAARTWVYGTTEEVLESRWRVLCQESDLESKRALFRETDSTNLTKTHKPLPSVSGNALRPVMEEAGLLVPPIIQCGYRSFDRQWVLADPRLIHRPRRDLWAARVPGQVFIAEPHDQKSLSGPGLSFSSLIPDMHYFNLRGGRALPLLNPDGSPNLAPGLLEAVGAAVGSDVTADDVLAYIAGVTGHAGFNRQFEAEMRTPGVRIPFTASPSLWNEAVEIGRELIWLQTYGEKFQNPSRPADLRSGKYEGMPTHGRAVRAIPDGFSYDVGTHVLNVGAEGEWHSISPAVAAFTVGGKNILEMWFKYRLKSPSTKLTSPLDGIVQEEWPVDWSIELSQLLISLDRHCRLSERQEALLQNILGGEVLLREDFENVGVKWPTEKAKPKYPQVVDVEDLLLTEY